MNLNTVPPRIVPDLIIAFTMAVPRPYSAENVFCMTLNSLIASTERLIPYVRCAELASTPLMR